MSIIKTEKKHLYGGDVLAHKMDDLVVWVREADGKVDSAWIAGGSIAASSVVIGMSAGTNDELLEVMKKLAAMVALGEAPCTCGCGKMVKSATAPRHFAGLYCEEGWERYKQANRRICGMCHKPMYSCYC